MPLRYQPGAAQAALHRAFQRGGVVAGGVVARQQQAGQGGLLRRALQIRCTAEGGALFRDDLDPRGRCTDAEFLMQFGDHPLCQLGLT